MSELAAEVIVVGGGPAGAATATWLARAGHDVLLLDKTRFPREKACGEYLSPGVVAALDRLGALPAVRAGQAGWLSGMRVCGQHERVLLAYDPASAGQPDGPALGIMRPLLDKAVLDRARACGVRVREGVYGRGALVEDGRVVGARLRGPAGEEHARARFVVAADGSRSAVARSLGLERPVAWPRRLGLVARYAGVSRLERVGEMHVGRGGYCGLAPVGAGMVTAGLVVPLGAVPPGEPVTRFYERQLAGMPGVAEALAGARRVTPVRGVGPLARRARRVAGPGYLLVGDAAGFLDPFTGEGVHRALRGAELAAAAIDEALRRGQARPVGYGRARRQAFGDKEMVCWLVQVFLSAPPLFERALGQMTERPAVTRVLSGVLGDYEPARPALRPAYLWSLLRP